MIPIVEERVGELEQLCVRYRVLRLDLFGSAITGDYHGESDLDFLVEFQTLPSGEYADAYFGLLEALDCFLDTLWTSSLTRLSRTPSSGNESKRLGHGSMQLEARKYRLVGGGSKPIFRLSSERSTPYWRMERSND